MAADDEARRKDEHTKIHNEIWSETIWPGIQEANNLVDGNRPPAAPGSLLHFTDAGALLSLLATGNLWVSRALASNDPSELDHGRSIALKEQALVIGKSEVPSRDQIFEEEIRASFDGKLTDGKIKQLFDPHICCFTTEDNADVVAHWAMYGRDGSGFALRFKGKALDNMVSQNATLVPVVYDEAKQGEHMRALLGIARASCFKAFEYAHKYGGSEYWPARSYKIAGQAFGNVITLHAATMKAPSFAAEKEWRLLHVGIEKKGGPQLMKADARGAIIRTYFEAKFVPDDLEAVIVGPVHAGPNLPVVRRLLEKYGYTNTKVETGKVALRTLR